MSPYRKPAKLNKQLCGNYYTVYTKGVKIVPPYKKPIREAQALEGSGEWKEPVELFESTNKVRRERFIKCCKFLCFALLVIPNIVVLFKLWGCR